MSVLTIDAGTTGVTALVVGENGSVLARGYQEFAQHYPQNGWVEHVPEEIWQATLAACQSAIEAADEEPTCIGITNQRETAVVWTREREADLPCPRLAKSTNGRHLPRTGRKGLQ